MSLSIGSLFVLFSIVIWGCKKDDTPTSTTTGVVFPLNVGNSWTFKATQYDTLGNPLNYSIPDMARQVYYDTLVGNERWFSLRAERVNFGFFWWLNKADGLWQRDMNAQMFLLYKFPASVNDSYSSSTYQITVLATNQSISVPLGTYACLKYQFVDLRELRIAAYSYVVPNLGEIKYELVERTPGGTNYIYESFELKANTLH